MRPSWRLSPEVEKEEEDNGRVRRNQFSRDERLHLLNVMSQYAPLLDDRSASVFDRREIWRAIERDFYQAGFAGRTSAQLKKHWQNYKYQGRRAQAGVRKHSHAISEDAMEEALHLKVPENLESSNLEITKIAKEPAAPCVPPRLDASLRSINESSGCRQREIHGDSGSFFRKLNATMIHPTDSFGKNRSNSEISQSKKFSSKICEEPKSSGMIEREPEEPIGTDVIVSNTDVTDNSVTVSVICPERTPEPFSKNHPKRKRDASLDRFSFHSDISVVSDASSSKKRKDDDRSIFPTAAGKGRCFLLQPRQIDNYGDVISNRRNAIEAPRKLEPMKEESTILPSKFASRNKVSSMSANKISTTTKEDLAKEDCAAFGIRDTVRNSTSHKRKRSENSKIVENVTASRSKRDDSDETANDAAKSRISSARLRDWDRAGPVQSELRDELNYRLTLHQLETEEKRLKVKIAEMAIQEIRFRIRALNENIRRADELHELHLALATAEADAQKLHV